jgi:hypothetical protein
VDFANQCRALVRLLPFNLHFHSVEISLLTEPVHQARTCVGGSVATFVILNFARRSSIRICQVKINRVIMMLNLAFELLQIEHNVLFVLL